MRVIAGKYGGRKLLPPKNNDIRPTTDKIKEALFGILRDDTEDAVVVDLFAGTGGLGIEALSRGAKKVYFCDRDPASLALLRQNLAFVPEREYEIIKGDWKDAVSRLKIRGVQADAIICDPPFDLQLGREILPFVADSGILKRGGVITVERATSDGALEEREFYLESTKNYGAVSVDVFRNYTKVAVTGTFDPFTNGHRFLVEEALKSFDCAYVVMLVNENKVAEYSVEKRLRMTEIALRPFGKRAKAEFYGGMTVDYCAERGISYIIRGVRNERDAKYERDMADYNRRFGVETLFVPAIRPEISSTAVREMAANETDVGDFVDDRIKNYLKKED